MSFEKNISRGKDNKQTLLKHCFSYQRKIDKSQTVCMMTDEKNSLHGVRFAHNCRINGTFIRECRAKCDVS